MKSPQLRLYLVLAMLLLSPLAFAGQEAARADLQAQGRLLLSNGDMAQITRLADQYRTTQQRTPAGFWALTYFYEGIEDVSNDPEDDRWNQAERLALDWHAKHPDSPSAIVVYAKLLNERGWDYRGNGYASTVTDDGYRKFQEYLAKAAEFLDANKAIGSQDPAWYSERIKVANTSGAPKEELFELATQGLDRYPTYYAIHYSMANALLPKWGGNFRLIRRYAALATAYSERAGEGSQAYARFYYIVSLQSKNNAGNVYVPSIDWPTLKKSLDDINRAHPDPWNLNFKRVFSCTFGDSVACRDAIELLNRHYLQVAWYDTPQWQKDCEDWALHGKRFDHPSSPNLQRGILVVLMALASLMASALVILRCRRTGAERVRPRGVPPPVPGATLRD